MEGVELVKSLGIEDSYFQEDDEARLLTKLPPDQTIGENCAFNSIGADTVAELMSQKNAHPYLIIDCRFAYEYESGHIQGAINIDNPRSL